MTEQPGFLPAATDVGGEVEALLASHVKTLTLEQKVRLLTGADFWSLYPEPDIGLRRLVVSDGPAGVRGELWEERDPSANVPSPTALAASWDTARVKRIGRLLAGEARAKASTSCWHPRSTCIERRTAAGTSSATARTRVALPRANRLRAS